MSAKRKSQSTEQPDTLTSTAQSKRKKRLQKDVKGQDKKESTPKRVGFLDQPPEIINQQLKLIGPNLLIALGSVNRNCRKLTVPYLYESGSFIDFAKQTHLDFFEQLLRNVNSYATSVELKVTAGTSHECQRFLSRIAPQTEADKKIELRITFTHGSGLTSAGINELKRLITRERQVTHVDFPAYVKTIPYQHIPVVGFNGMIDVTTESDTRVIASFVSETPLECVNTLLSRENIARVEALELSDMDPYRSICEDDFEYAEAFFEILGYRNSAGAYADQNLALVKTISFRKVDIYLKRGLLHFYNFINRSGVEALHIEDCRSAHLLMRNKSDSNTGKTSAFPNLKILKLKGDNMNIKRILDAIPSGVSLRKLYLDVNNKPLNVVKSIHEGACDLVELGLRLNGIRRFMHGCVLEEDIDKEGNKDRDQKDDENKDGNRHNGTDSESDQSSAKTVNVDVNDWVRLMDEYITQVLSEIVRLPKLQQLTIYCAHTPDIDLPDQSLADALYGKMSRNWPNAWPALETIRFQPSEYNSSGTKLRDLPSLNFRVGAKG